MDVEGRCEQLKGHEHLIHRCEYPDLLATAQRERDHNKRMVEAAVEVLAEHDECPPSRIDPDHGAICPRLVAGMASPGRCEACWSDYLDQKAKEVS